MKRLPRLDDFLKNYEPLALDRKVRWAIPKRREYKPLMVLTALRSPFILTWYKNRLMTLKSTKLPILKRLVRESRLAEVLAIAILLMLPFGDAKVEAQTIEPVRDTSIIGDPIIQITEVETIARLPDITFQEQLFAESIIIEPPSGFRQPVSAPGNTYYEGQCVWWAYERRMQMGIPVPNTWHNANQWLGYAQAQGWPTGIEPRYGAVGVRGNHVVVIEKVNGDGTVYLSEMNYDYNGGFRYRTVPASNFLYIY